MELNKVPNILIHCTEDDFLPIKRSLLEFVNPDRYTVYHLPTAHVLHQPWQNNAKLLLVKGDVIERDSAQRITSYYRDGGKVFAFDSVRFHQGNVNESDIKNEPTKNLIQVIYKTRKASLIAKRPIDAKIPEEGEPFVVDAHDNFPLVTVRRTNGGCFVSSLIDLQYEPDRNLVQDKWVSELKKTDDIRLEIWKEILESVLSMDCTPVKQLPLTACYLMGINQDVDEFCKQLQPKLQNDQLRHSSLTLIFCKDEENLPPIKQDQLPVVRYLPHMQVPGFDLDKYISILKTKTMGKVILFTPVLPTTMAIMNGLTDHPQLLAIAHRQTQGKGRSGNDWLSPDGCAMFSLPVTIRQDSQLGSHPTWLQHLAALAMVDGVLDIPGYEDLDVRIKWPNDVYVGRSKTKIGGLLVTSTFIKEKFHCVIGCGLNVSNSIPTTCLNDLIFERNATSGERPKLDQLTIEEVIAVTVNRFERLLLEFQASGYKTALETYKRRWMHQDAEVNLQDGRKVRLEGLDENGFLTFLSDDGQISSLQSGDYNSFDLMANLIKSKQKSL